MLIHWTPQAISHSRDTSWRQCSESRMWKRQIARCMFNEMCDTVSEFSKWCEGSFCDFIIADRSLDTGPHDSECYESDDDMCENALDAIDTTLNTSQHRTFTICCITDKTSERISEIECNGIITWSSAIFGIRSYDKLWGISFGLSLVWFNTISYQKLITRAYLPVYCRSFFTCMNKTETLSHDSDEEQTERKYCSH